MNPAIFVLLEKAIEKALAYIPDPVQKAAAQMEILRLQDSAEARELTATVELAKQQNDINAIEAGSSDKFASRWRPAIGWICAAGLAYQFLFRTISMWVVEVVAWWLDKDLTGFPTPLELDMGTLLVLLTGLLGLGAMRTVDKIKGVA